jgi:hypothetical protein
MKKLLVLALLAAVSLSGPGCTALNVAHQVVVGGVIAKQLLLPKGNGRDFTKPDKGKAELAQKVD